MEYYNYLKHERLIEGVFCVGRKTCVRGEERVAKHESTNPPNLQSSLWPPQRTLHSNQKPTLPRSQPERFHHICPIQNRSALRWRTHNSYQVNFRVKIGNIGQIVSWLVDGTFGSWKANKRTKDKRTEGKKKRLAIFSKSRRFRHYSTRRANPKWRKRAALDRGREPERLNSECDPWAFSGASAVLDEDKWLVESEYSYKLVRDRGRGQCVGSQRQFARGTWISKSRWVFVRVALFWNDGQPLGMGVDEHEALLLLINC